MKEKQAILKNKVKEEEIKEEDWVWFSLEFEFEVRMRREREKGVRFEVDLVFLFSAFIMATVSDAFLKFFFLFFYFFFPGFGFFFFQEKEIDIIPILKIMEHITYAANHWMTQRHAYRLPNDIINNSANLS